MDCCGDLSIHSFYSDPKYRYYSVRLDSFKNWGYGHIVDKIQLSRSGFYCKNDLDRVQCFACNLILSKWDHNDVVSIEHAKFAPECLFLKMTIK